MTTKKMLPYLIAAGIAVFTFTVAIVLGGIVIQNSLHRADCIELTEHFRRWNEAGSPRGAEQLANFLRGRRSDLVVSNRTFSISGTNYITQFAVTNLHSNREGSLFITTNGVLVWLNSYDKPKIQRIGRR